MIAYSRRPLAEDTAPTLNGAISDDCLVPECGQAPPVTE